MFHTIVLALHVIGASMMFGVVLFAFVVTFKKTLDPSKLSVLKNFYLFGTVGAIWQVATGVILYLQEGGEFAESKLFWTKIGLFVLDGIVAVLVIDRKVKQADQESKGEVSLGSTNYWALFSLLIIITIIILGVFLTEG